MADGGRDREASLGLRSGRVHKNSGPDRARSERYQTAALAINPGAGRNVRARGTASGHGQDIPTSYDSAPGSLQTTLTPARVTSSCPPSDSTQAPRSSRADQELASMRFPPGTSAYAPKAWTRVFVPEKPVHRSQQDNNMALGLGEEDMRSMAGAGQPHARPPRARLNQQTTSMGLHSVPDPIPGFTRLGVVDLEQLAADLRRFPQEQSQSQQQAAQNSIQSSLQAMSLTYPTAPPLPITSQASQQGAWIPAVAIPIPSTDSLPSSVASGLSYSLSGLSLPTPRNPVIILRKLQLADARTCMEQAKLWFLNPDVGPMGRPLGPEEEEVESARNEGLEIHRAAMKYVTECERELAKAEMEELRGAGISGSERTVAQARGGGSRTHMDSAAKLSPRIMRR